MAELNINGRMMVKNFKKQFKEEFGGSLRVYKGQNFADNDATLASIRAEGCKGGELTLRANMLVGTFEEKMQELFGIKVQVADADDKKLVDNALTLGAVGRGEVKKKAERKSEVDSSITPKEDMPIPASMPKWVELQLSVDAGYRLHLIPIIGEESNDMADEMIGNGEVDYGMVDDIECSLCDRDLGDYRLCFDFYNADEDHTWTDANGDVIEGVDENSIDVNINKGWFEEDGTEPDDNFKLIDKLVPGESLGNGDEKEIYKDIMARHNEGVDDEHVDIIKDAICRRMKQVSEQLVKDGLIDNADDARFILQFGVANECYIEYTVPVAGEFDSNLLRPLACEDWSDCSNVSEVMYEYMPDRLSELVVYDGKLYLGSCSACGDYNYQADIVNCDLESLMSKTTVGHKALMDWLKKECVVETDDEVYYDASSADDEEIELFISNIKAQNLDEENEKLEKMSFEAAAGFIKDEDDDLQLASKIVNAAYCTRKGIEIDDDTELYVDEQQYYIHDSRDFHYEYESDIDLG